MNNNTTTTTTLILNYRARRTTTRQHLPSGNMRFTAKEKDFVLWLGVFPSVKIQILQKRITQYRIFVTTPFATTGNIMS
jgi:hypothetical protein